MSLCPRKSILSLCFFLFIVAPIYASPLFTVEDIEVDVTADNAITARNQAFAEAQIKAFKILAQRMLTEEEAASYQTPDISTISTMIKDYEVTRERLSAVRYIGTYTVRFQENAVRRLFTGSGQSYTDVQSKPLLILPFYQRGEDTILWSNDNLWMKSWARSENTGTLVPLIVPIGDLKDVSDIDDDQALSYDERKLSAILDRYGAGEAVILVAVADAHLSMTQSGNQPATGSMNVNIYRTDLGRPEYVDQITLTSGENQTVSQLMDLAVLRVQSLLRRDWKSRTVVNAAEMGMIDVRVPIRTLSDWAEIRKALGQVGGITNIVIKSLSPKEAQVKIQYQGTQQRLNIAMDQADLSITTVPGKSEGNWNRYGAEPSYILARKAAHTDGNKPYSQRF